MAQSINLIQVIGASLLSILPIALWLGLIMWQDRKKPEPFIWLGLVFVTGIFLTLPVFLMENGLVQFFSSWSNYSFFNILVFLGIAFIEELSKFLAVFFLMKKNKYFDELIDRMIYLVFMALGFAFIENIAITYQEMISIIGLGSVLKILGLRFMGANLVHLLCSGLIGFFWALSTVYHQQKYLFWGIISGIGLHTIFNIVIMKWGAEFLFAISLALFVFALFILWAFDILKHLKFNFKQNKIIKNN